MTYKRLSMIPDSLTHSLLVDNDNSNGGGVDDLFEDMDSSPGKGQTQRGDAEGGGGKGKNKQAKEAVLMDDDSDDGMTFGRRKARRKALTGKK